MAMFGWWKIGHTSVLGGTKRPLEIAQRDFFSLHKTREWLEYIETQLPSLLFRSQQTVALINTKGFVVAHVFAQTRYL